MKARLWHNCLCISTVVLDFMRGVCVFMMLCFSWGAWAIELPPTSAAPTSVPTAPPSPPVVVVAQPVIATLLDGSQIEMDADSSVWALNFDGSKSAVPDGILTLKDGVTFAVKDGKRVDE